MTRTKPTDDAPPPSTLVSSASMDAGFADRPWRLALILVIITIVAYLPALRAGFIWDDDYHLTANWAMTVAHGLKMIWSSLAIGRYYPLTLTTFWVEHRLWGLFPMPYHLVNVLIHAANGVAVFFLLRRLRIPAAWLAAMVWTLHPVNVESVAWISELKNTQSGLFFFLSLLCFLKFAEQKQLSHRWYRGYLSGVWYVCALVCAAGAMLSNASTAILPLVLLLAVWWERGHWERSDAAGIAVFFGMAWLVSGLAILEKNSHALSVAATASKLGFAKRFVVAGKVIWFYAAKVVWPFHLAFVYRRWDVDAFSWWSWVPVAALVALGVVLWRRRDRAWSRAALFGSGCFLVALIPVLGFIDLFFFRYSFVADRFQYLACLGLTSLAVSAGATICARAGHQGRVVGTLVAAAVLLVLGALTWRHARVYRSMETIWSDTLAKDPQSWMAHYNLGTVCLQEGKTSDAIGHYDEALRLNPNYVDAHLNLGNIFLQQGKSSDAIEQYTQALRLDPDLAEAHCNLGEALSQAGRLPEAIEHYNQALRINPNSYVAHNDLGDALVRSGKLTEAITHYQQAIDINPKSAEAHYNMAVTLERLGRAPEAIAQYKQALQINPDFSQAQKALVRLHEHQ